MYHSMRAVSFLLLLLLGMSSSVDVEICPDESDINPCECFVDDDTGSLEVVCSEEQTLAQLKKSLNGLAGKKNINLAISGIDVGTVPSNFFSGLDIKMLEFDHCELDSLSDDGRPILLGLEDSLLEFNIMSSLSEENVPAKLQLGHLRNLKVVDLSYNTITEMGDEWFDRGPASLEYLTISNNGIQKLGNRAFANLINLQELSLDGNRFGSIQRSMLPSPAGRLETLELDNNALTSIPEDLFTEMPSLSEISLRTNGILRLDQRTWYPIWNKIKFIFLEGNPIECDSTMEWIRSSSIVPAISGTCHAPREVEGISISDYIDRKIHG